MTNIFILRELVSEEGVSEEHLADDVDEVDAVGQQHLSIRKCGFCLSVGLAELPVIVFCVLFKIVFVT